MLDLKTRFLARSGRTVYNSEQASLKIATEGKLKEHERVFWNKDVSNYEFVYGEPISFNDFEDELEYCNTFNTEQQFEEVVSIIEESPRFVEEEKYIKRLESELRFFDKSNNIKFLLKLKEMIDKFKEDNVVWGVGRGSCCASLVLFYLEIHDIDPVAFDIPFIELTKTDPDDYA